MPTPPPPNLFAAERPVRSEFARQRVPYAVRRFITVMILFAVVVAGCVTAYIHFHNQAPSVIPTIQAEGNYKHRPDQPGGLDVPHQDVEVYHELDGRGGVTAPVTEHLMPMPETPQPAQVVDPGVHTEATSVQPANTETISKTVDSLIAPSMQSQLPTTVTATAPVVAPVVTSAPVLPVTTPVPVNAAGVAVPLSVVKESPVVDTTPLSAVTKDVVVHTPTASVGSGDTAVQLASIPDQASAQQMMHKLQSKYAASLGDLSLRLVRADLGAKGIFYRIQSQPASRQAAEQICAAVKQTNAGCILVRN